MLLAFSLSLDIQRGKTQPNFISDIEFPSIGYDEILSQLLHWVVLSLGDLPRTT